MFSLVNVKGTYDKTTRWLKKLKQERFYRHLTKYAELGVSELEKATPVKTGLTASSWDYEIEQNEKDSKIIFKNSNINDGVPIAVIIQYGHGTGTGGYVQGIDYINPAMEAVFNKIVEDITKEVTSL